MTANQCKELIDQEILEYNTETDKFVRTIIVGKRRETDPHYNSVVTLLDDNDRVMGRDGDGIIYYDFAWESSGNEATRYQQRKIPEIIAKEVEDVPITESIEVFIEPVRVLGRIASDEPGFHEWIQDGGGLSVGQMKLIHGPDWTPPQDG